MRELCQKYQIDNKVLLTLCAYTEVVEKLSRVENFTADPHQILLEFWSFYLYIIWTSFLLFELDLSRSVTVVTADLLGPWSEPAHRQA